MGHVFHPGHEELHGITVVVSSASGRLYVGRYHETNDRGVVLHDVAVREPDDRMGADDWISRQLKFGVHVAERFLVVPVADSPAVVKLVEWKK
jgi:hypothetical protein